MIHHDLSWNDGANRRFGRTASAHRVPGRSARHLPRRGSGGASVKSCAREKSALEPDASIRVVVASRVWLRRTLPVFPEQPRWGARWRRWCGACR
jgi:hypothetical protein